MATTTLINPSFTSDYMSYKSSGYVKFNCKFFLSRFVFRLPNISNIFNLFFGKLSIIITASILTIKSSMTRTTKFNPIFNISKIVLAYIGVFSRTFTTFSTESFSWVSSIQPSMKVSIGNFLFPKGMFVSKSFRARSISPLRRISSTWGISMPLMVSNKSKLNSFSIPFFRISLFTDWSKSFTTTLAKVMHGRIVPRLEVVVK